MKHLQAKDISGSVWRFGAAAERSPEGQALFFTLIPRKACHEAAAVSGCTPEVSHSLYL